MFCISTALSVKLQSENAETYAHFVFIYKSPCKIFIYWPIFKVESSTDSYDIGLSIYVTQSKYHDILKADVDIRKV